MEDKREFFHITCCTSNRQIKRYDHYDEGIQYPWFQQFQEENFCIELTEAMATLQVSYDVLNLNFSNWSKVFADVLNKHAPVKSKRV